MKKHIEKDIDPYKRIVEDMPIGFAHCKMLFEAGKPIDFIYLDVNKTFREMTKLDNVIGKKVTEIFPDIRLRNPEVFEIYGRVASSCKPERFETYVERINAWLDISVHSTEKDHFVVMFNNITERKLMEETMGRVAREWQNTFDANLDAIWLLDKEHRIVRSNSRAQEIFNLPCEKMIGKHCWEIAHGTTEPVPECPASRACSSLSRESMELQIGQRWFVVYVDPILDTNSRISGFVHIVSDITERKRTEEELRVKEWAVESSINAIAISDLEGNLNYVNPAFLELWGYNSQAEVLGKSATEFWQMGEMASYVIQELHTNGGWIGELEAKGRDKNPFQVQVSASMIKDANGKPVYMMASFIDISERKKAAQTLLESEYRFTKIVEQAPIAMAIVGMDGVIEFINQKAVTVFGYLPEDIPTMERWWVQAYPDEGYRNEVIPKWMELVKRAVAENKEIPGNEYQVTCKDGTTKMMLISGIPVSGKIFVLFDDITERKLSEEALLESEERFSKAFRTSPYAFIIANMDDGGIVEVNDAFTAISGYSREEALTSTTIDLNIWVNEEDRKRFVSVLRENRNVVCEKTELRSKNGIVLSVLFSAQVIKLRNKTCIISIVEDITPRNRAEEKLRKTLERLDLATSAARLGIWDWDIRKNELVWDDRMYELYGIKREDFTGAYQAWLRGIHPDDRDASDRASQQARNDEKEFDTEFRVVWPDGTVHHLKANGLVVKDPEGKALRMIGINYDITERTQTENLLTIQHTLAVALNTAPTLTAWLELCLNAAMNASGLDCGGIYLVNEASMSLDLAVHKGLSSEFISSTSHFDSQSPNSRIVFKGQPVYTEYSRLEKPFDDYQRKEKLRALAVIPVTYESRVIGCFNLGSHAQDSVPVIARSGIETIAAQVGTGISRLRTETALRESEDKFKHVFDYSIVGNSITFPSGEMNANRALCELLGYSQGELNKKSWQDITHPSDIELSQNAIDSLISREKVSARFTKRFIHKNGTIVWADVSSSLRFDREGKPLYFMTTLIDITEQKRAEEELVEAQALVRKAFHSSPIATALVKFSGEIIIDLNTVMESLYGYPRTELIGKPITDFNIWENDEERQDAYRMLVEKGKIRETEYSFRTKSGRIGKGILFAEIIEQRGEKYILFNIIDITERKHAENALKESEGRFRRIVEQAPIAMAIVGMNGVIEFINNKTVKVFGYQPDDISTMERWWVQAYPDEKYRKEVIARWTGHLERAVSEEHEIAGDEYSVLCKDGTYKTAFISGVIVADKIFVLFDDITERAKMEEALRKSEDKFSTAFKTSPDSININRLSDGIYLEINQGFTAITGYEEKEVLGRSPLPSDLGIWVNEKDRDRLIAGLRAKGEVIGLEAQFRTKSGKLLIGLMSARIMDINGEACILSTTRDITERKMAEEALRESEERFRKLFEEAPLGIAFSSPLFAFEKANPSFCRMLGYSETELRLLTFADITHPEHIHQDTENIKKLENGEISFYETEKRYIDKNGKVLWANLIVSCIRDDRGKLQYYLAMVNDITERKQAEEELSTMRILLENTFEQSPLPMVLVSMPGAIIKFTNPAAIEFLGLTDEPSYINTALRDFKPSYKDYDIHGNIGDVMDMPMARALSGQNTLNEERLIVRKDGTSRWELVCANPIYNANGEIIAAYLTMNDITERKRMEAALYESEQHYKMVTELATDYVYKLKITADGNITMDFVSDNYYTLTGRTKEAALTIESWNNFIYPEDMPKLMALLRRLIASPQSAELEIRSFIRGKKLRWINIFAKSEWDEKENRVTEIVGAVKDISERKLAEEAVAAEKERLAVTLRSIGDGVIATDVRGMIVLMNKVAENLTGWQLDEAIGQPLSDIFIIINELSRDRLKNPVEKVLSTGVIIELANHTLLVSRDGTERIIADSGAPIKDKDGKIMGVVLVFRDMTEKQKILDTIQRTAKLDSLGVLAGGLAHDFNNLLTAIFGNIDLARSIAKNEQVTDYLDTTLNIMNRARGLTQQLLTFAKGGEPIRRIGSLVPFMQETVQFALSGSNVSYKIDIPDTLWSCNFDKNQIGQVIDNIVINAQQAMPLGGIIEISARNISLGENEHTLLEKGRYVVIYIKDRGIGIPKEILPRIFDPFFTTKEKGHGLGLAMCYSIMTRHSGVIEVESEQGKGTTFIMYLPASSEQVPSSMSEKTIFHKGSGTIIVLDDEESIRKAFAAILEAQGYNVVLKKDGEEVVTFFSEEHRARHAIAGIFLDLTVPGGMGGKQTVAKLREIDSEIPVFVVSGYADDPVIANPRAYGFTASICKPFRISELSDLLEKHLKHEERLSDK